MKATIFGLPLSGCRVSTNAVRRRSRQGDYLSLAVAFAGSILSRNAGCQNVQRVSQTVWEPIGDGR